MSADIVESVGPYAVERELGRGAFGVVYLARHQDDPDTPVALKLLQARGKLDRLLLEPAMLAKLNHPCVVRVLDYFPHADNTQLAIALEYVAGGDLKSAIDDTERFPPEVVRDLLVQIAGALAEAHGKGIVHRDLKPANILLDRSGPRPRYVLTDFGVGGEDEGLRSEKKVAGTYLFMAPEQFRGRPGPQSDLWALGVVAYRMLTGEYPFPGPTVAELAKQIQLTTPPPPSRVMGEAIDPRLEKAVLRLLDRSETERIGSAAELLRELGHAGDSRTVLSRRTVADSASRVGRRQRSLDETLTRGIRRNYLFLALYVAVYAWGTGLAGKMFTLPALALFYVAHARRTGWRKAAFIAAAFALLGVGWVAAQTDAKNQTAFQQKIAEYQKTDPLRAAAYTFAGMSMGVAVLVLPILACNAYAKANRLRRERLLMRAAAAGVSSDEYLTLLRRELDYRYEDVGFHLKYAEALAARGDDRAAAVEARLLLVQDPYHFTGNLLLAQCYHRLGLPAACARVCDDYLAVAGYCFEFAELRDQCRPKGGAA